MDSEALRNIFNSFETGQGMAPRQNAAQGPPINANGLNGSHGNHAQSQSARINGPFPGYPTQPIDRRYTPNDAAAVSQLIMAAAAAVAPNADPAPVNQALAQLLTLLERQGQPQPQPQAPIVKQRPAGTYAISGAAGTGWQLPPQQQQQRQQQQHYALGAIATAQQELMRHIGSFGGPPNNQNNSRNNNSSTFQESEHVARDLMSLTNAPRFGGEAPRSMFGGMPAAAPSVPIISSVPSSTIPVEANTAIRGARGSLRPWQPSGPGAYEQLPAGAIGAIGAESGSDDEAKIAHARMKNREAQQRFRERHRKQVEAQQQECDAIQEAVEKLELENSDLALRGRQLAAVLAVRETFVIALEKTAAAEAASRAEEDTASEGEGEGAHRRTSQSNAVAQPEAPTSPTEANPSKVPQNAHHKSRSGWSMELAISKSGDEPVSDSPTTSVEDISVPLPTPPDPKAMQHAMRLSTLEAFVSYWRRWEVELRFLLLEAEAEGAPPEARKNVEAMYDFMVLVWSYSTNMYPQNFKRAVEALLPKEDVDAQPIWRRTAERIVGHLTPNALVTLRKHWRAYLLRVTRAHDRQAQWLATLVADTAPASNAEEKNGGSTGSTSTIKDFFPRRYCDVRDAGSHVADATEEIWDASVQLCVAWFMSLGSYQTSIAHVESEPYMPDWVAITRELVTVAEEKGLIAKEVENEGGREEEEGKEEEEERCRQ